jgi:DNA primase
LSEHEPLQPLSDSQREALQEATTAYQAAVTPQAAAYLHARGIDRATAASFRLGVVADPFPGHERHRGKLVIPYLDQRGNPLTMRFRCIEEHDHRALFHGKYMSLTDDPVRVFNIGAIHRAGEELHVTEGEFDAMVLQRIGLHAVAIPGAKLYRGHHRRMMAGFSRVWVWGDPDDAGAELVAKITRSLRSAKGVRLRDGDVTDTYLAGGADALLDLISRKAVA